MYWYKNIMGSSPCFGLLLRELPSKNNENFKCITYSSFSITSSFVSFFFIFSLGFCNSSHMMSSTRIVKGNHLA